MAMSMTLYIAIVSNNREAKADQGVGGRGGRGGDPSEEQQHPVDQVHYGPIHVGRDN